jgi:hypothetical protein
MPIKIENNSNIKLPSNFAQTIESIWSSLPRDHTRGIERLRFVDQINDPRLRTPTQTDIPGLYHPRQGSNFAWIEVALKTIIPQNQPFYKRLFQRMSFKGNLAATLFSLVGQHYYLTLRHSIRKTQLEGLIRAYTQKNLRLWADQEKGIRYRIFKPFQPYLEKWARTLQRRAVQSKMKAKKGAGS